MVVRFIIHGAFAAAVCVLVVHKHPEVDAHRGRVDAPRGGGEIRRVKFPPGIVDFPARGRISATKRSPLRGKHRG